MLIYGKNSLNELIKSNKKNLIKKVYIDFEKHKKIVEKLKEENIKILRYKDFNEFKEINTQKIIVEIENDIFIKLEDLVKKFKNKKNSRIIILDQIFDPQNFGSIIRNAVAFEADAIIFSDIKNSPFNSSVVKSSVGTWVNIDLCKTNSIINSVNVLKRNDYWIVSTLIDGDKDINFLNKFRENRLAIILGSEGKGIRNSIIKNSDINIRINISKNVNSLNVSVTSALILNELYNGGKQGR